jgi:hypothetical protein
VPGPPGRASPAGTVPHSHQPGEPGAAITPRAAKKTTAGALCSGHRPSNTSIFSGSYRLPAMPEPSVGDEAVIGVVSTTNSTHVERLVTPVGLTATA